jgi:hypothetical protein
MREHTMREIEIIDVFVCVNMREAMREGMREGNREQGPRGCRIFTIQPLGVIHFHVDNGASGGATIAGRWMRCRR